MTHKVSLSGVLAGGLTAVIAYLLVGHYFVSWLLVGLVLGAVVGAMLARRTPVQSAERLR
jgi:NAD/NADP transhydrogenase beta subunit